MWLRVEPKRKVIAGSALAAGLALLLIAYWMRAGLSGRFIRLANPLSIQLSTLTCELKCRSKKAGRNS